MKKSDVKEVKIAGIVANGPTAAYVASLDKQTADMLNKDLKVTFVCGSNSQQAKHMFTKDELTYKVQDADLSDATVDVTIDLTKFAESGLTSGNPLMSIDLVDPVSGYAEIEGIDVKENKAVVEDVAPGQYKVTVYDDHESAYKSTAEYDVEFSVEKTEAVLSPDKYVRPDVDLAFDFSNAAVRLALGWDDKSTRPTKVELKLGDDQIVLTPDGADTVVYAGDPDQQLDNWEGYTATIYTYDGTTVVLKDKVDMMRKDAYKDRITHVVTTEDLPSHKMVIKYGKVGYVPAVRIVESENKELPGITKVEFKDKSTGLLHEGNITKQTKELLVAESGDATQMSAGEYEVVITQGEYPDEIEVLDKDVEFKLDESGDLVANLTDADFDEYYVYQIEYTLDPAAEGFKTTDLKDVYGIVGSTGKYVACDYKTVVDATKGTVKCVWQQIGDIESNDFIVEAVYNGGVKKGVFNTDTATLDPNKLVLGQSTTEYCRTYMNNNTVAGALSDNPDWAMLHIDINPTEQLKRIDCDEIEVVIFKDNSLVPKPNCYVCKEEGPGKYWVAYKHPGTGVGLINLYKSAEDVEAKDYYVFTNPPRIPPGQAATWKVVDTQIQRTCPYFNMSNYMNEAYKATQMEIYYVKAGEKHLSQLWPDPFVADPKNGQVYVGIVMDQGMNVKVEVRLLNKGGDEVRRLVSDSVDLSHGTSYPENAIVIDEKDGWKAIPIE